MSQAQLYHDSIIAEARASHGAGRLSGPDRSLTCDNPLCGDRVTLDLVLADGRVAAVAQTTRGCLLTQAAASLLARHAVGCDAATARRTLAELQRLLQDGAAAPGWPGLAMFAPVAAVRSRHECVLLPFRALERMLAADQAAMDQLATDQTASG